MGGRREGFVEREYKSERMAVRWRVGGEVVDGILVTRDEWIDQIVGDG